MRAVSSAPEREAASTTTVTSASAAISLFRRGKRSGLTAIEGGCSEIVQPPDATMSSYSG